MMPREGDELLVPSKGHLGCPLTLFVGVEPLFNFGYKEIRSFGTRVLSALASQLPQTRHVCLTIHGPGYGLDEVESFKAEIAGLVDAITTAACPPNLQAITFVERDDRRSRRLSEVLDDLLPQLPLAVGSGGHASAAEWGADESLASVGARSNAKKHIFVTMPFLSDMSDVYHYGIEPAVKTVAAICERVDQAVFTGEIMNMGKGSNPIG